MPMNPDTEQQCTDIKDCLRPAQSGQDHTPRAVRTSSTHFILSGLKFSHLGHMQISFLKFFKESHEAWTIISRIYLQTFWVRAGSLPHLHEALRSIQLLNQKYFPLIFTSCKIWPLHSQCLRLLRAGSNCQEMLFALFWQPFKKKIFNSVNPICRAGNVSFLPWKPLQFTKNSHGKMWCATIHMSSTAPNCPNAMAELRPAGCCREDLSCQIQQLLQPKMMSSVTAWLGEQVSDTCK